MKVRQIFTLFYVPILGAALVSLPASAVSPAVVISEVQMQSTSSVTEEFVELYNTSSQPVDITGWKVEYLTASNTSLSSPLVTLAGRIGARSFLLLSKTGYLPQADAYFDKGLNESGGHIRIVDAAGQEIDRVGWGTATAPEVASTPSPPKGKTLRREANPGLLFGDTNNNAADFIIEGAEPLGGGMLPPFGESASCAGLIMTEIRSNPAGADSEGGEFVELYNPTDAEISLKACVLATDKIPTISLPEQVISPHSYYVVELKDKLLNGGGQVVLTAAGNEQIVNYPELQEDEVWAWFETQWLRSVRATPGAGNVLLDGFAEVSGQSSGDIPLLACPEGKYRNPETNRCKTIERADSGLASCKSGHERNPLTNRCRANSALTGASLAMCGPGQERNPATNRCRKVAQNSASTTKPCPGGHERNPSTNRCRKITTPTSKADAATSSAQTGNKVNLGIIAAAGTAALGYGAYEYRTEMRNWFAKLKSKLPFSSSGGK